MCGIIGLLAFKQPTITNDKKAEKSRQEAMIILSTELLQNTQSRGKDATGIATLFEDNEYMGLKMGVSATEFVSRFGDSETHYNMFIDKWRNRTVPAAMVIGHCRKPTTGGLAGPEDNANNHPIKIGDTLGVHNGTIDNHNEILKQLGGIKPDGRVDSEAIFRLVNHYCKNGTEPFTSVMIQEVCRRINGQYACLTFNSNNPFQLAAFRDGRPLEFALIKSLGLLLIASEKDILKSSIYKYNQMAYLYNSVAKRDLVPLKKNDVDILGSDDDTLYIFDIRQEITEDTKIQSLYISEKIPRTPKIWVAPKFTHATSYNHTTTHNPPAVIHGQNKAVVTHQSVNSATIPVNRSGMLWNRALGRYNNVNDQNTKTTMGGVGNVIIDSESGKKVDLVTAKDVTVGEVNGVEVVKKNSLKQSDTQPAQAAEDHSRTEHTLVQENENSDMENLITEPSKIEVIDVKKISTMIEGGGTDTDDIKGDKVVVDMSAVDPKVIALAISASAQFENFKDVTDLSDRIGTDSLTSLMALPLNALANRVKNYVFAAAWQAGYMFRVKEEGSSQVTETSMGEPVAFVKKIVEKQRNARNRIRSLKVITRLLANISNYVTTDIRQHVVTNFLASKEAKSLDLTTLPKLYNNVELRENALLRDLMTTMIGKEYDHDNNK